MYSRGEALQWAVKLFTATPKLFALFLLNTPYSQFPSVGPAATLCAPAQHDKRHPLSPPALALLPYYARLPDATSETLYPQYLPRRRIVRNK